MNRYPLLALGFSFLVGVTALAQPKDSNKTLKQSNIKSTKDVEAELLLRERRANAQSLLLNLAADARNFNDAALRARTLARIADGLWETDRERSR